MATATVSLIDSAKVQKIQMQNKPFSNLFQMLKRYPFAVLPFRRCICRIHMRTIHSLYIIYNYYIL